jgi:hypothetical protein
MEATAKAPLRFNFTYANIYANLPALKTCDTRLRYLEFCGFQQILNVSQISDTKQMALSRLSFFI